MGKTGATGITRVISAFFYSMQGLRAAWQHEAAFRQECVIVLLLLPVAYLLGSNAVEYVLLVGSLFIVLITELINSAIEAIVDRVGTEHHALSGRAKDTGSAAVFIAIVLAMFVWGIIAAGKFG